MDLFSDDLYVSPGSLGGKIKKYRELRGMTQKQLGIACGFSQTTADVRIAQYEKNKKTPRKNVIIKITEALGLHQGSLYDADFTPINFMYHALFDIESFHGLHPVEINGQIYLEFSSYTLEDRNISYFEYADFLSKWYKARMKYQAGPDDSPEEKRKKANEYELWKGEYPMNIAMEVSERLRDKAHMDHLQAEMDLLHAKMSSESEFKKIDDAVETYWENQTEEFKPIKKESELILLIRKIIESNVKIKEYLPVETYLKDDEYTSLFSIRIQDVMENKEHLSLFAELERNMHNLYDMGYSVRRVISSSEKEPYITYKIGYDDMEYFENIMRHWNEMENLPGYKDHFLEKEFEEKFMQKVTGENDMEYIPRNKDGA